MTRSRNDDVRSFPIVIFQDRYRGAYAGGAWVAVAEADHRSYDTDDPSDRVPRIARLLTEGPFSSDPDAMMFWNDPPDFVAVGDTPDQALAALVAKRRIKP